MRLPRVIFFSGIFALLTVVLTWPQAAYLATRSVDHQDIYFNLWRLGWIAHALTTPAELFGGNVFHPEPRVLTYSDALLIEALLAAPLLWAGVPPVLVHNVVLLGGMALSGAAMGLLARHLTGSTAAGVVAGMVFAFAPYRFDHYMHLELQWAVWAPLAFLALERTLATASWRWGLATGLAMALQFLSSIYYGIFLATLLPLVAVLRLLEHPARWRPMRAGFSRTRAFTALLAGAALCAALCVPYAIPYLETREQLGGRGVEEIATYSARPGDYLVATPSNALYGDPTPRRSRTERRLFPGAAAVLLALVAVTLRRPPTAVFVYLLALAAAFEMSLGIDSYAYRALSAVTPTFDALRAPARLGIFVLLSLGVLAAYGYAALEQALGRRWRTALAATMCAVLSAEYWTVPLRLIPYPNTPPPLYDWLSEQPRGVVAELPLPVHDALPGHDARFMYLSTFHWMPMINGYSGFYPQSYLDRLARLEGFPNVTAVRQLADADVTYIIVHPWAYPEGRGRDVVDAVAASPALVPLGAFESGRGAAHVYRLRQ